jgi:hypothetical protein
MNPERPRRRKRTPKTAKILRNHSSVRAAQRYKIYLDEERRAHILALIHAGCVTDECRAIEKQSNNRTLFRVIIEGQVCGVVYDAKRKELVTFIPPESPILQVPLKDRASKEEE